MVWSARCAWVLCLATASCAAARRPYDPAGASPTLLPPDLSIQQVFKTDDEAAKGACAWLWKSEPKAERFEYRGFIIRDAEGIKATVPVTEGRASRCLRPPDPPGVVVNGFYHSHRMNNDFSNQDRTYGFEIARYLCAPNKLVKKLTPEGTVIVK